MKKLITLLVIIVLVGGAGAGYYFTRPAFKVDKAVEANDMSKVSALYPKLKEEKKTEVQHDVLLYCGELLNSYVNQEREYDDVMAQLSPLAEGVMKDNAEFGNILDGMEMYKTSRESWAKANEFFDAKDYSAALAAYSEVVKGDYPYEEAQKKIEECRNLMVTMYAGDWYCDIEIGKGMLESQGLEDYGEDVIFPLSFHLALKDDKTATMCVEAENLEENFEKYINNIVDIAVKKVAEEAGVSVAQLNKVIKSKTGMSLEAYVKESLNVGNLVEQLETAVDEYTYELKNETTIVLSKEDGTEMEVTIEGNELLIEDVGSENAANYKQMGVEVPLRFAKRDAGVL